jgi:hypothetical protein
MSPMKAFTNPTGSVVTRLFAVPGPVAMFMTKSFDH